LFFEWVPVAFDFVDVDILAYFLIYEV
jgi:hypothetical protein